MAAVLVLLAVSTITTGEIIRGRNYPDKIDGSPCPWEKPIAASEFGASGVKCLEEREILKYGKLIDINVKQWVHWTYKHFETYVFENFSWKRQSLPIQRDRWYVIIEPRPGRLQMIKHHDHGLIFRTRGKDWWNLPHRLTTTPSLTMAPPSSPRWAPTTAAGTLAASSTRTRSVTSSSSSLSHTSTLMTRTSKQTSTTTDHLPAPTLFISTTEEKKKKKKKKTDLPLPTSTLTTSTPKLSTTTTITVSVLVTSAVLGACFGAIMVIKKYINGERQVMAEENNIFLNPSFSEETAV